MDGNLTAQNAGIAVPQQVNLGNQSPLDKAKAALSQMPQAARLAIVIGIPLLLAFVIAMFLWAGKTEYKVLFNNLSEADGGAIVDNLNQMQIPYKYNSSGTAILVPSDKVYDTRLQLASKGLPKTSTTGFEVMDDQPLGVTQFQEQVNFQRGLEGELAKTIKSLAPVQDARVHLAIPKPSVFVKGKQEPSASVVVSLHQGKSLSDSQVQGIVHLISSSLPSLKTGAVSIVDQNGNLLSNTEEGGIPGAKSAQLTYLNEIQGSYTSQIIDILTPLFGRENIKATVTADVDFAQVESTKEAYRPNGDPAQAAVRSQQISESADKGAVNPSGVPGVLSNTPPNAASAPIAGNPQNLQNPFQGADTSQRKDSTVNYELDKEVVYKKEQVGSVRRLSAAVVINYKTVVDPKGVPKQVPLTTEEMTQISALIKKSIGYNQGRGDEVEVINQQFASAPISDSASIAPEQMDMIKSFALPLGIAAAVAVIVFGLLRPLLRPVIAKDEMDKEGPSLLPTPYLANGQTDGAMALLTDESTQSEFDRMDSLNKKLLEDRTERLNKIRGYAKENPELVVSIIRQWMISGSSEEPTKISRKAA